MSRSVLHPVSQNVATSKDKEAFKVFQDDKTRDKTNLVSHFSVQTSHEQQCTVHVQTDLRSDAEDFMHAVDYQEQTRNSEEDRKGLQIQIDEANLEIERLKKRAEELEQLDKPDEETNSLLASRSELQEENETLRRTLEATMNQLQEIEGQRTAAESPTTHTE